MSAINETQPAPDGYSYAIHLTEGDRVEVPVMDGDTGEFLEYRIVTVERPAVLDTGHPGKVRVKFEGDPTHRHFPYLQRFREAL